MLYIWNSLISIHLTDYIYITTFLKFQTPTPKHILNIFDWKHKHFKNGGLRRVQIATLTVFTNKLSFYDNHSKAILLNRLPIPYMKSINNSSKAYVPIYHFCCMGVSYWLSSIFHRLNLHKIENTHQIYGKL